MSAPIDDLEEVGRTDFQPTLSHDVANEVARVINRTAGRNVLEDWGVDEELVEAISAGLVMILKEEGGSIGDDHAYLTRGSLEVALQTAMASGLELALSAITLGKWTPEVPGYAWPVEYSETDCQLLTIVPYGVS